MTMKGTIPRSFINDLLAKVDIYDVINSRVKLKKAGSRDYNACCPFHHEKTPSFTVSTKKQFYHCFGCGAHGNAISFLMEYDKLEFVEAIEELAASLGLEVPRENLPSNHNKISYQTKRDLYELMLDIATFYRKQLSLNINAQAYLNHRGLSQDIIVRFNIGFSPNNNAILSLFSRNAEQQQRLFDVGMLSRNDERGSIYDKFRNRIIFPIRDRRGRTVAFGGRVLGDEKPKYLNSPETIIYHKGNELYGLFEALQINEKPEKLLFVEGYMDVVALAQFGIDYAVASLGTATTPEQIQQAFKTTEQIIFCYDGDRAGQDAAWRAFENALPYLYDGRQIKFIFLPEKEDPDSFIRAKGKLGFEEYIESAVTLSDFLFARLLPQVDLTTNEGKTKLAALAIPLIKQIPGEMLTLYLRTMLAQKLGILDQTQLESLIPDKSIISPQEDKKEFKRTNMRILIALLLQNPELANTFISDLSDLKILNEPGFNLFFDLVKLCQQNVGITTGQLLEHWRGKEEFKILEFLSVWNHLIQEDHIEITAHDIINHFYTKMMEKEVERIIAKERQGFILQKEEKKALASLLEGIKQSQNQKTSLDIK